MAEAEAEDDYDPLAEGESHLPHVDKPAPSETDADKIRKFLDGRRYAYRRVFAGNPSGDDVKIVMEDLRRFCRGGAAVFHRDDRVQVLLTGRQEVYYRIEDHLKMDLDELFAKYTATPEGN